MTTGKTVYKQKHCRSCKQYASQKPVTLNIVGTGPVHAVQCQFCGNLSEIRKANPEEPDDEYPSIAGTD